MQVALFSVAPGDSRALDDLNRFLRGHRVLTLDRQCLEGVWSFCVTYQPPAGGEGAEGSGIAGKVDYKQVLDEKTFALFSRLRELRKTLAETEKLPPYAVFTNEQLAQIARERCASGAALEKVPGIGPARIEKYGAAVFAAIAEHDKQQSAAGADRGPGKPA
jgi:superfamily II DNA helicase RecQ